MLRCPVAHIPGSKGPIKNTSGALTSNVSYRIIKRRSAAPFIPSFSLVRMYLTQLSAASPQAEVPPPLMLYWLLPGKVETCPRLRSIRFRTIRLMSRSAPLDSTDGMDEDGVGSIFVMVVECHLVLYCVVEVCGQHAKCCDERRFLS